VVDGVRGGELDLQPLWIAVVVVVVGLRNKRGAIASLLA
jgi:hypothetical protein